MAFSSCRRRASSLACRTVIADARFWICERSFWQDTTIPVGMWVIRTAESVVLTPWPPGPGRAVHVDPQLLLVDLDVVAGLDDRRDLDAGERGLPPALVVERGDADQAVGALLDREGAVGVGGLDLEGGRLDAGLFRVGRVVDLGGVAVTLRPAQIHPHQHLGEVRRVDAAGLGADGDQGFALVVLAGQQGTDLLRVDLLLQARRALPAPRPGCPGRRRRVRTAPRGRPAAAGAPGCA